MKNRVVVFGKENSLYTKMVVYHLKNSSLDFDLILESGVQKKDKKRIHLWKKLKRLLNAGAFKSLSIFHWFTWFLLYERYKNKKNATIEKILIQYNGLELQPDFIVSSINNKVSIKYLKDKKYDYALFAGVGIVKNKVIEQIQKQCINAHPAPLPQCRGGGALECTLFNKLNPSVSVHIATEGIDEGDIFAVKSLKLYPNDNFLTLTNRLTELCAIELVDVTKKILNAEPINLIKNNGELNYWKDWSDFKQIQARANLKRMLKDVKN